MAVETLDQWATRLMAARVTVQQPRPALNRRSLIEAENARRTHQAAVDAHQQRMAQRDAQRATAKPVAPAPAPSLGGSLFARVAGVVLAKAPEPASPASIATSTDTRRKGMRLR